MIICPHVSNTFIPQRCAGNEDDLEYFVRECGDIFGIKPKVEGGQFNGKHILESVLREVSSTMSSTSLNVDNASVINAHLLLYSFPFYTTFTPSLSFLPLYIYIYLFLLQLSVNLRGSRWWRSKNSTKTNEAFYIHDREDEEKSFFQDFIFV